MKRDLMLMWLLGCILGGLLVQFSHETYSCNLILDGLEQRYEWRTSEELNITINSISRQINQSKGDVFDTFTQGQIT